MDAMKEGQNCEMVYSFGPPQGAHAVDLVGMGKHNGQPWVLYSSDVVQAGQGANLADSDSRGAGREGLEFEYLGAPNQSGIYTGSAGNRIEQVVCEKYVPPPAGVTVTGTQDPAGHSCCVPPPPSTANLTVNGTSISISMAGTASWLPLSGTINANGSFTLTGTATAKPAMRVNGFRDTYAGKSGELLRPSITMNPGSQAGTSADWWLIASGAGQYYHFDLATMNWQPGIAPVYTGPLANIPFFQLPYLSLPSGTYDFYFGFDTTADGALTMPSLVYETTRVTVQ